LRVSVLSKLDSHELTAETATSSSNYAWDITQEWLYARRSDSWVRKEATRRPGVSFQVPHWRFYIPAVLARFALFTAWLGTLFFLLFVLPGRVSELERFVPGSFPF
jgi:hypothetical protein